MKRLLPIAILLTACQTVPSDIEAIKQGVDNRITYTYYAKNDYRYLPQGGTGNCAVFAYNYAVDAMRKGYTARTIITYTETGEAHAVAVVDNKWVLDNRLRWVETK